MGQQSLDCKFATARKGLQGVEVGPSLKLNNALGFRDGFECWPIAFRRLLRSMGT